MKRTKLKPVSDKTRRRNARWRKLIYERAAYLREKYGYIICEYSQEPILALSSTGEYLNDGWGHHIDGNRNNCTPLNCLIVKYKYHTYIHDHNLKIKQEDFMGVKHD